MPCYLIKAGKILGYSLGELTEEQCTQWGACGTIVNADGIYPRKDYFYEDGQFVAKPEATAAEKLAKAAVAKRLELTKAADTFVSYLTDAELAVVQAVDPSRTAERYPATWLAWARGQNDLALLIEASETASAEAKARAADVKLSYLAVASWTVRVTAGPLATAYAALASAVTAGDIDAVNAVAVDFTGYEIGGSVYPDPDVTQVALWFPLTYLP